jgi:hypothetical protein
MVEGTLMQTEKGSIKVFVSHSESDAELVQAFISVLHNAMDISPQEIRCTSVDACKLFTGAEIDNQLRDDIVNATAFTALLTPVSL